MNLNRRLRLFALLLGVLILFSIHSETSLAAKDGNNAETVGTISENSVNASGETSGSCGDNLTWELETDGTLSISGKGNMWDYAISDSPFAGNSNIRYVFVKEGVTSIGDYAFYSCNNLYGMLIASSVSSIGENAFAESDSLVITVVPNSYAESYAQNKGLPYYTHYHNYNTAKVTKEATCTTKGIITYTCPCNATKTEEIPALGHGEYVDGCCVRCGKAISLATPVLSKVENVSGGQKITWKSVAYAESYNVYRKSGSTGWKRIGTSTTTVYTDKTVTSGVVYTYTVRAVFGQAISGYDNTGKSLLYIATPSLSSLSNVNGGQKLTWTKSTGASGYYVYRKTSTGWARIAEITNGSTVTYTNTSVTSGTSYTYTVKAFNGSVTSSYNSTGKSLKYIATPTLSGLSNVDGGQKLTWSKSAGASGYYVYRKTSNGWSRIADITNGSTVTYTNTSVTSGTSYTYTVKAYYGNIYSSYNSTGKSLKYLQTPTPSNLTNVTGGQKFEWKKVTGASGYYVYRKTEGTNWAKIATVSGVDTLNYTDKTVKSFTTYTYTVRAFSGSVMSYFYASGISHTYVAVTTVKSVSLKDSGISVSWAAQTGASGYAIYYSTDSSFPDDGRTCIKLYGSSTTSAVITNMAATTYYVKMATYKTVNGVRVPSAYTTAKKITITKGASMTTMLSQLKSTTANRSIILELTNNAVDISKYSTTIARIKAIYTWHAKNYNLFAHCLACNDNFNACIYYLIDDKTYDDWIHMGCDRYKNNSGSIVQHKWSVLFLQGVPFIFDPRMQGNVGKASEFTYFGITYGSTLGKHYLLDYYLY